MTDLSFLPPPFPFFSFLPSLILPPLFFSFFLQSLDFYLFLISFLFILPFAFTSFFHSFIRIHSLLFASHCPLTHSLIHSFTYFVSIHSTHSNNPAHETKVYYSSSSSTHTYSLCSFTVDPFLLTNNNNQPRSSKQQPTANKDS